MCAIQKTYSQFSSTTPPEKKITKQRFDKAIILRHNTSMCLFTTKLPLVVTIQTFFFPVIVVTRIVVL